MSHNSRVSREREGFRGGGVCLRHSVRRLSAPTRFANRRVAKGRAGRRESRFAPADRGGRPRGTSRARHAAILAHMRRLHLCASCFSCAPPCCKSRVTLARTDPLLTLPAAEAAANWHMRAPRYPKRAPCWYAETVPSTLPAFTSPPAPPPPPPPPPAPTCLPSTSFYEIFAPFGTRDALVFTPIHKLRIAVAPAERCPVAHLGSS